MNNQSVKQKADPVSRHFYGAYADAVVDGSAPDGIAITRAIDDGAAEVKWTGECIDCTFYRFGNVASVIIRVLDQEAHKATSTDFRDLASIVWHLDRLISKSMDIMFDYCAFKGYKNRHTF